MEHCRCVCGTGSNIVVAITTTSIGKERADLNNANRHVARTNSAHVHLKVEGPRSNRHGTDRWLYNEAVECGRQQARRRHGSWRYAGTDVAIVEMGSREAAYVVPAGECRRPNSHIKDTVGMLDKKRAGRSVRTGEGSAMTAST